MALVRGRVVSFAAATWRASVRLDGSAPQVLEDIRVSHAVGAAAMVAGALVLVDLGDHGDPNDAVVVAAWGDGMAPGGGHTEYVEDSLFVAKGDVLAATGAGAPARVAVGPDGAVLVADGAQAAGVRWEAGVVGRSTTLVSVASSAAETNVVSFSVPAGVLGTARMLRLTMLCDYLNNGSGTSTLTLRVKYGATTLWGDVTVANPVDVDVRPMRMVFELANLGATNSQRLQGAVFMGNVNAASVAGQGDIGAAETGAWPVAGTSAEDSTLAKNVVVTVQHSVSNANTRFRMHYAVLELV